MGKNRKKNMEELKMEMEKDSKNFEPGNPLGSWDYEELLKLEQEYIPNESYSSNFDPIERELLYRKILNDSSCLPNRIPYQAMTYFDRYQSRQTEPYDKSNADVLSITCLILAIKMNYSVFPMKKFLKLIAPSVDTTKIWEKETEILGELKWKMKAITPICFVDMFVSFLGPEDRSVAEQLVFETCCNVSKYHQSLKYTKYRPSFIAASTLLKTSTNYFPKHFLEIADHLGLYTCMNKGLFGKASEPNLQFNYLDQLNRYHMQIATNLKFSQMSSSPNEPPQAPTGDDREEQERVSEVQSRAISTEPTSSSGPSTSSTNGKEQKGRRGRGR